MGNFKKDVFGKNGMLHKAFGDAYEIRDARVSVSNGDVLSFWVCCLDPKA